MKNCKACQKEIPKYRGNKVTCSLVCNRDYGVFKNYKAYYERAGKPIADNMIWKSLPNRRRHFKSVVPEFITVPRQLHEYTEAQTYENEWHELYKSKNRMTRIVAQEQEIKYNIFKRLTYTEYKELQTRIESWVCIYSADDILELIHSYKLNNAIESL